MKAALYAETLKLRRSKLPWITLLAITVGVAVGGLFMFISLHPDAARDRAYVSALVGLLGPRSTA